MVKALFNAVIVKRTDEEESTYGTIVVPDMGKEKKY
jgi:co-chaperonin GroES (HSP10)